MEQYENEGVRLLIKSILALENEEECAEFLDDLMTRKEIDDIAQRMYVAKMLREQAVYSKIVERTGASTATISRVNRAYNYGRGAYAKILTKVEEEKD